MDAFSLEDLLTLQVSAVRRKYVMYAFAQQGKPYLWGIKGPNAFDCSGLVTCGISYVGGPDLRQTHNAQLLFNETPTVMRGQEQPGDLVFYGMSPHQITHVVIYCANGRVISASGGDHTCITLDIALRRGAKVTVHPSLFYRKDVQGIHQNSWLTSLEKAQTNGTPGTDEP